MAEQRKREAEQDAGAKMRREAWARREARRRKAWIAQCALGVIVLGVATGLAIVYKDQILALLSRQASPQAAVPPSKAQPQAVAKQVEPSPPKALLPKVESKAAIPEVPARVEVGSDDAAVKGLIDQGRVLVEQLEFGKAAELFKEASQKGSAPR